MKQNNKNVQDSKDLSSIIESYDNRLTKVKNIFSCRALCNEITHGMKQYLKKIDDSTTNIKATYYKMYLETIKSAYKKMIEFYCLRMRNKEKKMNSYIQSIANGDKTQLLEKYKKKVKSYRKYVEYTKKKIVKLKADLKFEITQENQDLMHKTNDFILFHERQLERLNDIEEKKKIIKSKYQNRTDITFAEATEIYRYKIYKHIVRSELNNKKSLKKLSEWQKRIPQKKSISLDNVYDSKNQFTKNKELTYLQETQEKITSGTLNAVELIRPLVRSKGTKFILKRNRYGDIPPYENVLLYQEQFSKPNIYEYIGEDFYRDEVEIQKYVGEDLSIAQIDNKTLIEKVLPQFRNQVERLTTLHRDIKTENTLIDKEGNIRIIDFSGEGSLGTIVFIPLELEEAQKNGPYDDFENKRRHLDIYAGYITMIEVLLRNAVPEVSHTMFDKEMILNEQTNNLRPESRAIVDTIKQQLGETQTIWKDVIEPLEFIEHYKTKQLTQPKSETDRVQIENLFDNFMKVAKYIIDCKRKGINPDPNEKLNLKSYQVKASQNKKPFVEKYANQNPGQKILTGQGGRGG